MENHLLPPGRTAALRKAMGTERGPWSYTSPSPISLHPPEPSLPPHPHPRPGWGVCPNIRPEEAMPILWQMHHPKSHLQAQAAHCILGRAACGGQRRWPGLSGMAREWSVKSLGATEKFQAPEMSKGCREHEAKARPGGVCGTRPGHFLCLVRSPPLVAVGWRRELTGSSELQPPGTAFQDPLKVQPG